MVQTDTFISKPSAHAGSTKLLLYFTEISWSVFAETFWSLKKHFGHLSHSCIKTHCNSVF